VEKQLAQKSGSYTETLSQRMPEAEVHDFATLGIIAIVVALRRSNNWAPRLSRTSLEQPV
jgi:hypothetical protein